MIPLKNRSLLVRVLLGGASLVPLSFIVVALARGGFKNKSGHWISLEESPTSFAFACVFMGLVALFCLYAALSRNQKRKKCQAVGYPRVTADPVPFENPPFTLDTKPDKPGKNK